MPALGSHYLSQAQVRKIFNFKRLSHIDNYAYREGPMPSDGHIPPYIFGQGHGRVHSPTNYETSGHGNGKTHWIVSTTIVDGPNYWHQSRGGTWNGYGQGGIVTKAVFPPTWHSVPGPGFPFPYEGTSSSTIPQGKYHHYRVLRLGACSVAGHAGTEYERLGMKFHYYCIDKVHGFLMSSWEIINEQSKVLRMLPPGIRAVVKDETSFFILTQIGGVPPIPIPAH